MAYLLGIDLGTSSVRSLVMDESGKLVALAVKEYQFDIPHLNWAEQDAETWWDSTVETLKEVLSKVDSSEIKGIGFSGQMHALLPLDKQGKPVRKAIIWCDKRTNRQVGEITSLLGKEGIASLVQNPIGTGFLVPSLLWLKQYEPQSYKETAYLILPKDYIRFRLTGLIGTDYTDASATLAFDVTKGCWSDELISKLGFERSIFPDRIGYPSDIGGKVTAKAARETGLQVGTKVVFGGADQVMQAIGNGLLSPGEVSVTIGTGGQVLSPLAKPVIGPTLVSDVFSFYRPDSWYYLGATLSGGLSLRWLRSLLQSGESYAAIDAGAEKIPIGSENLIFLPYLSGERTPYMDSNACGMFFGLALRHTSYHLFRAVMEGVTFSMKDCLGVFSHDFGGTYASVIASGGASQSPFWLQMQADVFNVPVYKVEMKEQASTGAAITAGVGVGIYSSYQEACSRIVKRSKEPILPNAEAAKKYAEQYHLYRDLYQANKEMMVRLSTLGE
jgi:xylulokinase